MEKRLIKRSVNEISFEVKRYLQEATYDYCVSDILYGASVVVDAVFKIPSELKELHDSDPDACDEAIKFLLRNDPIGQRLWDLARDGAIKVTAYDDHIVRFIAEESYFAEDHDDDEQYSVGHVPLDPQVLENFKQEIVRDYEDMTPRDAWIEYDDIEFRGNGTMEVRVTSPYDIDWSGIGEGAGQALQELHDRQEGKNVVPFPNNTDQ